MPKQKSGPKKKANAKARQTERIARGRGAEQDPRVPSSKKQRQHGRFPGEAALTGEDRPSQRAGGKKQGQATAGRSGPRGVRTPGTR
jgi:hypothetical protein